MGSSGCVEGLVVSRSQMHLPARQVWKQNHLKGRWAVGLFGGKMKGFSSQCFYPESWRRGLETQGDGGGGRYERVK